MKLYHRSDFFTIYHGDADQWPGHESIDLVLTNPYGPMPAALRHTPMLIHQWAHRKGEAARWVGIDVDELQLVGAWNDGRECFWAANMAAVPVDVAEFRPAPGGWYPLELPLRLLSAYARKGQTVWDGFMGRGTIGVAAELLGLKYVGIEQLEAHLAIARDFLNLDLIDGAA